MGILPDAVRQRGAWSMDILQSIMEASSQAMFTLDREGTITHINQQTKD